MHMRPYMYAIIYRDVVQAGAAFWQCLDLNGVICMGGMSTWTWSMHMHMHMHMCMCM